MHAVLSAADSSAAAAAAVAEAAAAEAAAARVAGALALYDSHIVDRSTTYLRWERAIPSARCHPVGPVPSRRPGAIPSARCHPVGPVPDEPDMGARRRSRAEPSVWTDPM